MLKLKTISEVLTTSVEEACSLFTDTLEVWGLLLDLCTKVRLVRLTEIKPKTTVVTHQVNVVLNHCQNCRGAAAVGAAGLGSCHMPQPALKPGQNRRGSPLGRRKSNITSEQNKAS